MKARSKRAELPLPGGDFWQAPTLDELTAAQGVCPVATPEELKARFGTGSEERQAEISELVHFIEAAKIIPDEVVDDAAIVGDVDYVRKHIAAWEAAAQKERAARELAVLRTQAEMALARNLWWPSPPPDGG